MTRFKLGIYQGKPVQGNIEATLQLMENVTAEASGSDVQLLVFPELFITGYLPDLWEVMPTELDEQVWLNRLVNVSKEQDVWLVFGHPSYRVAPEDHRVQTTRPPDEQSGRGGRSEPNEQIKKFQKNEQTEGTVRADGDNFSKLLTNAVSLLSPQGVVGTYAKVHLFGDESNTFAYGSDFPVWETPFGKIAIQICYDLEFPEAARAAALQGAELLINPANNMSPYGPHHRCFTMARALENSLFVATVNRTGPERGIDFCGGSCVAHPSGKWLLETDREEGLFVLDIHLSDRAELESATQYLLHRRPETYGVLSTQRY